jgi:site-specific recombinase XerD
MQRHGKAWSLRFVFEGQRIEQTTGHSNLRRAEAYAEAFRTRLRNEGVGILEKKPIPNFKNAMADFLVWSGSRQKKNTASRYETASKALISYFGRVPRVDRITNPQIEKFITWRKSQYGAPRGIKPKTGKAKQASKKKISNATVNRELACLKKMFSNLVADGVLTTNPVKLVKFLVEDSEPGRVLNREEEGLYLLAASQPLQDYATLLVETGLRPDELCKLAVQDVFSGAERPYLMVRAGKTKSARRTACRFRSELRMSLRNA